MVERGNGFACRVHGVQTFSHTAGISMGLPMKDEDFPWSRNLGELRVELFNCVSRAKLMTAALLRVQVCRSHADPMRSNESACRFGSTDRSCSRLSKNLFSLPTDPTS